MPACCRCNGSGRCVNCTCVKSGKLCNDCLPSRKGCCQNQKKPPPPSRSPQTENVVSTSEPAARTPVETAPTPTEDRRHAEATQNAILTPSEITPTPVIPKDAYLPPYPCVSRPCFKWGCCAGPEIQEAIIKAYNQVVHWHRNIFKIPAGKAGKIVVKELTRLFEAYADATTLESVAITAAMVLPSLILQKPH